MEDNRANKIGIAILCFLSPVVLGVYFGGMDLYVPYLVLGACGGSVAFGIWSGRQTSEDGRLLKHLAIVTGSIFAAAALIGIVAREYVAATGYHTDFFRRVHDRYIQFPFYGQPAPIEQAIGAALSAVLIVGLVVVMWRCGERILYGSRTAWYILAVQAALMTAFASTDGLDRLVGYTGHYEVFAREAASFGSVSDLLATYIQKMGSFSFRPSHFPPGYMLVLVAERQIGLVGLFKFMVYACALGLPHLNARFARDLGLSDRAIRWVLILTATATPILVLPSTSPMPVVAILTVAAQRWILLSLWHGSWRQAVLGALTMACLAFLIFSVTFVGLTIVVFSVLGVVTRRIAWKRVLMFGGLAAAVFSLFFVLIHAASGFDILACLAKSIQRNQNSMGGAFDSLARWSLRSTGSLTAFLGTLGLVQAGLFFSSVIYIRRHASIVQLLIASTMVSLLVASVSGLYCGETERAWLYFMPGLTLIGGCAADAKIFRTGFAFALSWTMLFSLNYELLFRHY